MNVPERGLVWSLASFFVYLSFLRVGLCYYYDCHMNYYLPLCCVCTVSFMWVCTLH